jgi:Flp pilus assembly protein protease CpaA
MMKLDPIVFLLTIVLTIASLKDLFSFRIPNWLTYPALAVGITYFSITKGYEGFLFSLGGALAGFGLLTIPYIIGGTGAGDVKLMGAVGSFRAHGVFMVSSILYSLELMPFFSWLRRDYCSALLRDMEKFSGASLSHGNLFIFHPPLKRRRLK